MRRLLTFALLLAMGCTVSENAPSTEYFLFKEWRLDKVTVNGEPSDEDVSAYRIMLMEDFSFVETGVDGLDYEGTWTLSESGTIVELNGTFWAQELSCPFVEFLIVELQLRELVVRPLKGCDKLGAGNLDIIYHLVPVKQ